MKEKQKGRLKEKIMKMMLSKLIKYLQKIGLNDEEIVKLLIYILSTKKVDY